MYFKYNKFRLSIDHLNLDKMTTLSGNYPPCRYHPKINISLQSLKYKAKQSKFRSTTSLNKGLASKLLSFQIIQGTTEETNKTLTVPADLSERVNNYVVHLLHLGIYLYSPTGLGF